VGYRPYTYVWVGVTQDVLKKLGYNGGEPLYDPGHSDPQAISAQFDKILHNRLGCEEDEILVVNNNDLKVINMGECSFGYGTVKNINEDSRMCSGIGWGIIISSNLKSKDVDKVYKRAEEMLNTWEKIINKYFDGNERDVLLTAVQVHTDAVII